MYENGGELKDSQNVNGNANAVYIDDNYNMNQNNNLEMHRRASIESETNQNDAGSDAPSYDKKNEPIIDNKNAFKHHEYFRSVSIKEIKSPRVEWQADKRAPHPTEGLKLLWIILTALTIFSLAGLVCFDQWMVNIYANLATSGVPYYSYGAFGSVYYEGKPSGSNPVKTQNLLPMTYIERYRIDAGYLLFTSCIITIICIIFIVSMLCARCNSHILLYVKCCNIRIPQRASIYTAFNIIKSFMWITVIMYIFLSIYGLLEMNFYATFNCTGQCYCYLIPHFGFFAIIIITFIISCCAFVKTQNLDIKFSKKSIQLYYPENVRMSESRNCSIDLDYLLRSISDARNILILTTAIFITFRNSSLINIVLYNRTRSDNQNHVMYFEPIGLQNIKTNFDEMKEADSFVSVCNIFLNYFCPITIVSNIFIINYLWFVVAKFRSVGCCKFFVILLSFIETFVFIVLVIVYYWEFHAFYTNYYKQNLPLTIYQSDAVNFPNFVTDTYNIFWGFDWGIILLVTLLFYMIRFLYFSFKAM